MITTGIIFIIVLTLALIVFLRAEKQEQKSRREVEKRLEDEHLYNLSTGQKMLMEDAEDGIFLSNENRIKTDEEIEVNYPDELKDIQYIEREILQLNLKEIDPEEMLDKIERLNLIKNYHFFTIDSLYELTPNKFIGLTSLSYSYLNGRVIQSFEETQLFGIICTHNNLQHLFSSKNYDAEYVDNLLFIKLSRKPNVQDLKNLMNHLTHAFPL
jgi:hypothetical protein